MIAEEAEQYDAIVLGAGITGLTAAEALQRRGQRVLVLEKSPRVGGAIQSIQAEGYTFDCGPNTLQVNRQELEDWLKEIELWDQALHTNPSAKRRFLVRHGRILAAPDSPWAALKTPLFSALGKLRLLREPWVAPSPPDAGESLADFVERRLGREMLDYAINPFVGGIYAGRPEMLSVRYAFPKLWQLEQNHGSLIRGAFALKNERRRSGTAYRTRLISFAGGLETLPKQLAARLGEAVQTNVTLDQMDQSIPDRWQVAWHRPGQLATRAVAPRLVVTVPYAALASLPWSPDCDALRTGWSPVVHPPLTVWSLGFRRDQVRHPLDGFGMLIPEKEQRYCLGVLFNSALFAGKAPDGHVLLTVFVGGTRQPDHALQSADAQLNGLGKDLHDLLGVAGKPAFVHQRHWPEAIPQYGLEHGALIERITALETLHPGLRFAGNYRHGISLPYCIEAGLRYASSD